MTSITLNHVTRSFPNPGAADGMTRAVNNVTFKLVSGEVLAIIGPSGCGKSTLLRLIAGLMQPDSGDILYDNVPLQDVPLRERGIGMVFQEGALIPHWEARESVGFFLKLRKREHEIPERIATITRITGLGLEKLFARRPSQLSGGEQQRVSVARALMRDKRVLLFDEPFANLDAKLRAEARIELKRLLHEFPITSIYVTHDQMEAVALSNRIAVMRDGHFEQIGTFRQLYDSPVNLFVAAFIGTPRINLFEGIVENGHWQGENFGGYAVRGDLPNGTPVTMGIRPQFMRLETGGTPGVVDQIIPFLAERHQLVEVWLSRERWTLSLPLDEQIEWGSTIYCALDEEQAMYFDTQTGVRIG